MSEALSVWWSNPITGAMLAGVALLVLLAASATVVAVARLGGIQLGALLSQQPRLLPGVPRRGETFAVVLLFLVATLGLVLVLFSLALSRAVRLASGSTAVLVVVELVGWLVAIGVPLLVVRGARVEPLAALVLALLRPTAPLLSPLVRRDDAPEPNGEPGEEEEVDEHDLQAFIGAGTEAGIIASEEGKLIESIVEMGDSVAREIMTPRTDVVAVAVSADFEAVRSRFIESMYTRLPVFRDSLDRIEGVVHVKDVMRAAETPARPGAGALMRPVLIVPETKPLGELLREFQARRQQLAVVVDEYGGTSGIVTLEDVLEEIVGEIQDEHEREAAEVEAVDGGAYLVAGGANVDVLEELFDVDIDEEGFDSVAGLVLERLGHLPRPGEAVRWRGLVIEVVEVDRRRLRRVRVRREAPS